MSLPSKADLDELLTQITTEIAGWGRNYAPIPFALSMEGEMWRVFVDVRSTPMRSFDFEVCNQSLKAALERTLIQVKREMS